MAVSALDSRIFRNLFGTQEIRDIFSDSSYTQYMIETECALARAQSAINVIPSSAGDAITKASKTMNIDFDRLGQETDIVGYPVLPLTKQMISQTPDEYAKYIHWGATTQDIMDTASVLQMRHGLALIERHLSDLITTLRKLASKHRDTVMPARTHLQHALPCTFGYKCAVYLSSLLRHQQRLKQLKPRCLQVQFAGAAGTLASLTPAPSSSSTSSIPPDIGLQVRAQLAKELDLQYDDIPWHASRDSIAEILSFLALLGGSLGKIAYDVIIMSSNELGEVSEPFIPGRGASSTMPQKRNPISSEVVLAASKLLRANAGLGLDAMVVDFERASGPWHLEWVAIPDSFVLAVGALHQMNFALSGLVVNADAMERNLLSTKGLIVGEAVMMGLATQMGRGKAHDVVYEACKEAIEGDKALVDVLKGKKEVVEMVGERELEKFCDPKAYLGVSQLVVDKVLEMAGSGSV